VATPGQFASFDFTGVTEETLNRTWTISSPTHEMKAKEQFSVTIKKVSCLPLYSALRPWKHNTGCQKARQFRHLLLNMYRSPTQRA
jgi:hypothetical protein